GVSILALQILKAMQASVIITSSSNEKLQRAKELGADHTINYKENPEWGSDAFALSNGGVDLVIEIGGESTFPQTMNALKIGGHISVIGALGGINVQLNLMQMVFKNAHMHGITVGSREDHSELNQFFEEHEIHPIIGKTVGFDDAIKEIYGMPSGSHFGKIVIDINN
ncbi:MAG: zinc-dependent alcohol dehydrogenase family protein, partial [Gammaproteobacteria bacterium]